MKKYFYLFLATLFLAGCTASTSYKQSTGQATTQVGKNNLPPSDKGREIVVMSMWMIDKGYKFGGKNPEAGIDCSGLVTWIYREGANYKLAGSARDQAKKGTSVNPADTKPGDLVFFNTRGFDYSHVGIYVGDGKFIHAPNSKSKVRIDRIDQGKYASKYIESRTYF